MALREATVWKYPLRADAPSITVLRVPKGARALSVQLQDGVPCVWALVDPAAPLVEAMVAAVGTGKPFEIDHQALRYLGSVIDDPFVWHYFASVELEPIR